MSVTTSETTVEPYRRISRLAIASFLCGLATPFLGVMALADVGSDLSDLLTLTFPLFLVLAVVCCVLAHRAKWKAPEQLRGTGFAKAGALLATVTVLGLVFLIPAL